MIKNIISGIKAYFGAFSLISKLKLWKYFAIPMLISLITAIVIFGSAYTLSDNIGNYLSKIWIWDWGHDQQLIRGIRVNGRNLLMELVITIPILLLKFIPVVNIFSTILLFTVQAYYAGFGNMDYTLERHYQYKESVQFVRKNRGLKKSNNLKLKKNSYSP